MKGLLGTMAMAICLSMPRQASAATQYEAESATRSGGANINTNHPGYTGTGFVDGYFNSSTAQTVFTVPSSAAGSATVTVRYSAGNGTSTNTGLYVNGTKLRNLTLNGTANWDTWATKVETVTLNAGNNTIGFKAETASGSSINLDNIVVQTAAATFSLTVAAGTGGTITAPASSPVTVSQGAATPITAAPGAAYNFVNWTVTSGTASIASATSASTTATLNTGNATVTANFAIKTYALTATAGTGGSVTVPASSPITVNHGAATAIAAAPAAGYTFANWTVTSGSATFASPSSASTTVALTSAATIRANFTATPAGASGAVTYAQISAPVTVTDPNTVVLALPFNAPAAGHITVVATGLYGTTDAYTHEQRGVESFITLNSTTGGPLSGFSEKANLNGGALYVNETAGFPVSAGANTVRLIVSPRIALAKSAYSFAKCKMTVVFSPQKM